METGSVPGRTREVAGNARVNFFVKVSLTDYLFGLFCKYVYDKSND
jgi:hypothetical protein